MRFNFTKFRPKWHILKKECAANSQLFVKNCQFSKKVWGVPCRSVGSVGRRFSFSTSSWTTRSRFARAKMVNFQIRSAPQFHNFHNFSSKIGSFQKRNAPRFHECSWKSVNFQKRSAPQFHKFSRMFTNFRRKLSVFKKGVRLNFTNFHKFSSKIVSFQKKSAHQFP